MNFLQALGNGVGGFMGGYESARKANDALANSEQQRLWQQQQIATQQAQEARLIQEEARKRAEAERQQEGYSKVAALFAPPDLPPQTMPSGLMNPVYQEAQAAVVQPTARDLARTIAPYNPEKALTVLAGAETSDAKLESLREMLTIKQQAAIELANAKTAAQQAAIEQKYQNAMDLQKEKYDLLKGVKMAGVSGGNAKPPMGYRYNGDSLEPIPGGPADAKGQDRARTAEGAMLSLDSTIASLKDLQLHPGRLGATGTIRTGWIPGTDAADFAAKLDTFKAQTFVPMVQQMKGMGQLSDAEGKKLTESVGALNPKMSEKGFNDSLATIMKDLMLKKELVTKYMPNGTAPNTGGPKVGDIVKGYMYMGGDPANKSSWGKR